MGLLDFILLWKLCDMDDEISRLNSQLNPSITPETREDIEDWIEGRDKYDDIDALADYAMMHHLSHGCETRDDIDDWLDGDL